MIKQLQYPFDPLLILKTRCKIRKELILSDNGFIDVRIALLGGSTTHDIKEILELFLLGHGLKPIFHECEFGQYWQEIMFDNTELCKFRPELIYIHTSNRNITQLPTIRNTAAEIDNMLTLQFSHFQVMWRKIEEVYHCPVIQCNFELPYFRLLGNRDCADFHGRTHYIARLNMMFSTYSQEHDNFHILDIHSLSAWYGLEKWSNPLYWHMYKYSLCVPAIPLLAHNLANIIKAMFGKNKKAIAIDLDNTLWGGVVGDDGVEGLEIGHETSMGQVYGEFQSYIRMHRDLGVVLNVVSKNDHGNAIRGLEHPEGTLHPDDFTVIKANWENKDANIRAIASLLNIFPDSIVFIDDNPVERGIVAAQVSGVAVPEMDRAEHYIEILDRSGFFEVVKISEEDLLRNEMYKNNINRLQAEQLYLNYDDYLISLDMTAQIRNFEPIYLQRITQLTNKSNQFNLTTKRYTESEMENIAVNPSFITLYGKLSDKYGDNGLVSVMIGKKESDVLHLDLLLMSCRVLKRNMEHAMLDMLVKESTKAGITKIIGYYCKTAKNDMVRDFYRCMGFTKINENGEDTIWELITEDYREQNKVIKINSGG